MKNSNDQNFFNFVGGLDKELYSNKNGYKYIISYIEIF